MSARRPRKMGPKRAEQAWRDARSYAEICELTAQFIEGRSGYIPGYGATSPAEETREIAGYVAALNRAGLLTENSQPAQSGEFAQRADVSGLALEPVARRIA